MRSEQVGGIPDVEAAYECMRCRCGPELEYVSVFISGQTRGENAMTGKYGRSLCAVVCAAALICMLAPAGWATTYYVSTTGSDTTGDGSKANPWKSINKGDALKILVPGDKVVVAAGHYYAPNTALGWLITNCSGTAAAPITYIAQGKVILDGSVQAGGVARTVDGTVVLIGHVSAVAGGMADYIVFDGFEIIGSTRCLDVKQYNNTTYAETGVIVRNCILRDTRTKTGAAGGVMLLANGIHDCQFYNNVIAITDDSLIGATRAFSSDNNICGNKIYNNTIYIKGPASTASPLVINGGFVINKLSSVVTTGIMDMTKLEWNDQTGMWPDYAWNVAKTPADPPAPGDPEGTDYRNQFKNNIIWARNTDRVFWNTTNPVIYPTGGQSTRGHDPGMVHTNNAFAPGSVDGVGGTSFIAFYLAGVLETMPEANCPFPESTYAHHHVFSGNEFETNDIQFENTAAVDFRLKKSVPGVYTNPAIDAGVDVGLPFYGAAPDLGAVESMPDAYAAGSIADALAQSGGSVVKLASSVVTSGNGTLLNNMIYIEEETRASGVAVQSSPMLTQVVEGQRVEVMGTLIKSGAQPVINAFSIKLAGGGGGAFASETPLKPVGTPNKSAVGDVGLDNTGLLATIWGKVTAVDSNYFCVDDGSGRDDGMGHDGIPVLISEQVTPLTTPTETYVAVTGVLGKKDLGGGVVAVVRPRVQADIR
jgi:hypothetical protein